MHADCSTAAALPYEVYNQIVENLHHPSYRGTLLSLSLVSKAWSAQSQRILYMEFSDQWSYYHEKVIVSARHSRFLSTIIDHPTRIGPLVRTYAQVDLANAAGNGDSLRGLTIEALPAMVNLQHLHIIPLGAGSMPPNLFKDCTFQLRSLTLLFGLALSGTFLDFLRTQPGIRYLCIAPSVIWPCEADLSRLPEDVCPNLLSTSCIYESMEKVTKGRSLIALDTMVDFDSMQRRKLDPYNLDFGRVKYLWLRLQAGGQLCNPGRIVGNNIIILKLDVLEVEVCGSISPTFKLNGVNKILINNHFMLGHSQSRIYVVPPEPPHFGSHRWE